MSSECSLVKPEISWSLESFRDTADCRLVLLGTAGTGKSTWLLSLLRDLSIEGKTVLFQGHKTGSPKFSSKWVCKALVSPHRNSCQFNECNLTLSADLSTLKDMTRSKVSFLPSPMNSASCVVQYSLQHLLWLVKVFQLTRVIFMFHSRSQSSVSKKICYRPQVLLIHSLICGAICGTISEDNLKKLGDNNQQFWHLVDSEEPTICQAPTALASTPEKAKAGKFYLAFKLIYLDCASALKLNLWKLWIHSRWKKGHERCKCVF